MSALKTASCLLVALMWLHVGNRQATAQSSAPFVEQPRIVEPIASHAAPQSTNSNPTEQNIAPMNAATQDAAQLPKLRPQQSENENGVLSRGDSGTTRWTIGIVLTAIVIAVLLVGRHMKKHSPFGAGGLPSSALEVLGQRPLNQRQSIHMVRCGSRILLVGSSLDGLTTLGEITDPTEVDYLAGLCQTERNTNSMTDSFRLLFQRQQATQTQSSITPSTADDLAQRFRPNPKQARAQTYQPSSPRGEYHA